MMPVLSVVRYWQNGQSMVVMPQVNYNFCILTDPTNELPISIG